MSTAANEPRSQSQHVRTYRLHASAYDQVSSGLLSALMFVGALVAVVLLLYFSTKILMRQTAVPISMNALADGDGAPRGSAASLKVPAGDDVPVALQQEASPQSPEAIASVVASRTDHFDDDRLDTPFTAGGGPGDGPGGTGDDRIGRQPDESRPQRWVIRFDGGNLETYAKQLDFFKIELAAMGDDHVLHYAANLSKSKPVYRTGSRDSEKRLHMIWQSGAFQAADRQLLVKAGIVVGDRIIMQFYPDELEKLLAQLEREYAGDRHISEIRRTTFEVRRNGEEFTFVVTGQQLF